jgi:hypothetical protein
VAAAGDVNGDGLSDYLLGAPGAGSKGRAFLFFTDSATSPSATSDADIFLKGAVSGSNAGTVVAAAGDQDNDGYADILVGAPGDDTSGTYAGFNPTGAVFMVHGSNLNSSSTSFDLSSADAIVYGDHSSDTTDGLGGNAYSPGDVNGDGHDDVLMSAPDEGVGTATNSGEAFLFLGPLTGTMDLDQEHVRFTSDSGYAYLGWGFAGGDMDADGLDDIIITAPDELGEPYGAGGSAYIFFAESGL